MLLSVFRGIVLWNAYRLECQESVLDGTNNFRGVRSFLLPVRPFRVFGMHLNKKMKKCSFEDLFCIFLIEYVLLFLPLVFDAI